MQLFPSLSLFHCSLAFQTNQGIWAEKPEGRTTFRAASFSSPHTPISALHLYLLPPPSPSIIFRNAPPRALAGCWVSGLGGWRFGVEELQSIPWSPNSSRDCARALLWSAFSIRRGIKSDKCSAKGESVKIIENFALFPHFSPSCLLFHLLAPFFSFSPCWASRKSLPLSMRSHQAGLPGQSRPHPFTSAERFTGAAIPFGAPVIPIMHCELRRLLSVRCFLDTLHLSHQKPRHAHRHTHLAFICSSHDQ